MIKGEMRRDAASVYLAEHWGLSYTAPTLANMARKGTGPVYRLRGRYAYYTQLALDEWAGPRIGGLKRRASDDGVEGAAGVIERAAGGGNDRPAHSH